MRIILKIMRLVFWLLYHPFAWTYDLVAATVSLGRWKDWGKAALPFLQGERILELGYGPGHLHRHLHTLGLDPVGLDESRPMSRIAARRLRAAALPVTVLRGLSQALPLPTGSFDSVLATFPSEYIVDPRTLAEIHRVLVPGGRLVIIPGIWFTGSGPAERLMSWLFRVTGQGVDQGREVLDRFKVPFDRAGFVTQVETVAVRSSTVLIIIARKV
jgi:ubiquinone/menaquinone biosynthesis C-methylase UbiE